MSGGGTGPTCYNWTKVSQNGGDYDACATGQPPPPTTSQAAGTTTLVGYPAEYHVDSAGHVSVVGLPVTVTTLDQAGNAVSSFTQGVANVSLGPQAPSVTASATDPNNNPPPGTCIYSGQSGQTNLAVATIQDQGTQTWGDNTPKGTWFGQYKFFPYQYHNARKVLGGDQQQHWMIQMEICAAGGSSTTSATQQLDTGAGLAYESGGTPILNSTWVNGQTQASMSRSLSMMLGPAYGQVAGTIDLTAHDVNMGNQGPGPWNNLYVDHYYQNEAIGWWHGSVPTNDREGTVVLGLYEWQEPPVGSTYDFMFAFQAFMNLK